MNKKVLFLLLFLTTILLSACYVLPQPQTDISVVMHNNSFAPTSWRVPAGATITLHITNQDTVTHDWTIVYRQSTTPSNVVDPASIYWQHTIEAGKSEDVQFTAPAVAGDYQVVSSERLAEGMVGKLTVVRLDSSQK